MDDTTSCLTKTECEKIEYSHSANHIDVFVCVSCGKPVEEKMDSSG